MSIQRTKSEEVDEMIDVIRAVKGEAYANSVVVSVKSAQAYEMFRQVSLHLEGHCGDHNHQQAVEFFQDILGDINAMAVVALGCSDQKDSLVKDARAITDKAIYVGSVK